MLEADYGISCESPSYKAWSVYATVMIFIYPIGVPFFFFALLYRYRKHISCSQTAVLRMHMVFRQGVLCNTRKCGEGEKEVPRFVKVPAPPQEDEDGVFG